MTKSELITLIEKSGIVLDFSRSYLMKKQKSYLVKLAAEAEAYMAKAEACVNAAHT